MTKIPAILLCLLLPLAAEAASPTPANPIFAGRNLWGGDNFEQGCPIPVNGVTFTPICAVNYITITANGQTIATPTIAIPPGSQPGAITKSIELRISYSGAFLPTFSATGYLWPIDTPPGQCGGAVTTGCLSAVSGATDWVECRSIDATHVGCGPPLTAMSNTPPYTGPGDVVAGATSYWGLRAYTAAVAATGTQKAINLRRASDSATTDILILTSGALDVATANSFCASTTCTVATFYDQTGNGYNLTNATPANQPLFVLNCTPNSQPCVQFSLSTWLANAAYTTLSQPFNMSVVVKHTGNFGSVSQIVSSTSITQIGFDSGANTVYCYAGSFVDETAADNAFHAIQCTFSDGAVASATNIDGTDFATTLGTGGINTGIGIGGNGTGQMVGQVTESGVWPTTAFSSAQRTALGANQRTAYGF